MRPESAVSAFPVPETDLCKKFQNVSPWGLEAYARLINRAGVRAAAIGKVKDLTRAREGAFMKVAKQSLCPHRDRRSPLSSGAVMGDIRGRRRISADVIWAVDQRVRGKTARQEFICLSVISIGTDSAARERGREAKQRASEAERASRFRYTMLHGTLAITISLRFNIFIASSNIYSRARGIYFLNARLAKERGNFSR